MSKLERTDSEARKRKKGQEVYEIFGKSQKEIRSPKKHEDEKMKLKSSEKEYSEGEKERLDIYEKTDAELEIGRVFKKLEERIYNLEKKMDVMEKAKRRNNLAINRQEVNGGKIKVKKEVKEMLKNKM
ncbi:hypothetical protein FQR65_LT09324 [Abscondita terminalis]|nr:hypothetical protein FQR65_LT09324 [Abscondita terminalis]